jgi:hypothetical protein
LSYFAVKFNTGEEDIVLLMFLFVVEFCGSLFFFQVTKDSIEVRKKPQIYYEYQGSSYEAIHIVNGKNDKLKEEHQQKIEGIAIYTTCSLLMIGNGLLIFIIKSCL